MKPIPLPYWCWGVNGMGQVGDGTTIDRYAPVQVSGIGSGVTQVSVQGRIGLPHACSTCVRKTDGTAWCWGDNRYGQLGDGTTTDRHLPVQVESLGSTVAQVEVGKRHACARKNDGAVWCWGYSAGGQLGNGTTTHSYTAVQVSGLSGVDDIAVGGSHTCAHKTDGSVWCWGHNGSGILGTGSSYNPHTPLPIALDSSVAGVVTGQDHSCALKVDGTLWCWGQNRKAQLGVGDTTTRNVPTFVSDLGTNVVEVATGHYHTCARTSDGCP